MAGQLAGALEWIISTIQAMMAWCTRLLGFSLPQSLHARHLATRPVERLSPFLSYHPAPRDSEPRKPRVILFPWLGATTRGFQKYIELYHEAGMDVVQVHSNKITHFLWPKSLRKVTTTVLPDLAKMTSGEDKFVIHASSVGAYIYTVFHMGMSQSQEFRHLTDRIVGHVFDSIVIGGLERMASGVALTTTENKLLQQLIIKTSLLYFYITKTQTTDFYDKAIEHFYHELTFGANAPTLFFYCGNDAMADPVAMKDVMGVWRKRGLRVYEQFWPTSLHAGHLRQHPEDYMNMFKHYLDEVSKRESEPNS